MANESHVPLTAGLPETVLPDPPAEASAALDAAVASETATRKEAVARVAADYPRYLAPWAELADLAAAEGHHVESYAYARVGYHRGLDALRGSGWRGSGFVRWAHPSNRGFLRSLQALRLAAKAIGEKDEEERCAVFLAQLDPDLPARR
ncbi:MAG: DUF3151 family protein [Candidatus Dormibacteraeota bacterium]|nr:DUF3151 family protein [Candidatus Dormibacteraeota bacterium]